MTHSPADVVRWLLIGLGQGIAPTLADSTDWQIANDKERDSPDNTITTYDTDGQDDGRSMPTGDVLYHYGFQVRVRSKDKKAGWTKASAIREALATQVHLTDVVIDSSSYVVYCIAKIGGLLSLGWDTPNTKRSLVTLNALVTLRQVS